MSGTIHPAPTRSASDSRSVLNRRRFLGFSSGLLCCATAAPQAFAGAFKPIDIGPLADFKTDGISTRFVRHNFFLIRHEGRIHATIATCPHKGNYLVLDLKDPTRIVCTGHDAVFDAEGRPVEGIVKTGLARFAISLNEQRRILVDPNKEFPQDKWNQRESFLPLAKD